MIAATAQSGQAELDQWFTPFWAAEELVADGLKGLGKVSMIEPSCGVGSFLAAFPESNPAIGIDIDPLVVPAAMANTGREIRVGDFRDIDLSDIEPHIIMGNPPFGAAQTEGFIDRAHGLLPEGGRLALILPGYAFQTPSRVTRWMDLFEITVDMIPRTLFPRLSKSLVWVKFTKTGTPIYRGLMLFREKQDIDKMRKPIREALRQAGTWREAVRLCLEALGGEASLAAIYDFMTPERKVSKHWRPKIRQTLQYHHRPIERGRWAL